jgi:hypothetical protein
MSLWLFVRNAPWLFWPPAVVFGLHLLRQLFLPTYYEFDMVAHFFGGFSMAWVAWNVHRFAYAVQPFTELPKWLLFLWIVSIAELIGVLWEFMEYYYANRVVTNFNMTLGDTILDLVLDLAGAILFSVVAIMVAPRRPWHVRR